jgi:hypothetical protein
MKKQVNEILSAVSQASGISEERLRSEKKTADICDARSVYLLLCLKHNISRIVATSYIGKTPAVMSQQLCKKQDKVLIEKTEALLNKNTTKKAIIPNEPEYCILDVSSQYFGTLFCIFKGDSYVAYSNSVEECREYILRVERILL